MKLRPLTRGELGRLNKRNLPELLAGAAEADTIPQTQIKAWREVPGLMALANYGDRLVRKFRDLHYQETGEELGVDELRQVYAGLNSYLGAAEKYLGLSGSVEGFKVRQATAAFGVRQMLEIERDTSVERHEPQAPRNGSGGVNGRKPD